MMAKVFVVTSGCYSDYAIRNVFSTEQLAEDFMNMFSDDGYPEWNDIEEWEVDALGNDMHGKKAYRVRMNKKGVTVEVDIRDSAYGFECRDGAEGCATIIDIHNNMCADIAATDEEHAVKIANERRVRLIAENRWHR